MNVLGDQRSLPQHSQEDGQVQRRTPEPMAGIKPARLLQVSPEQDDGEPEQDLASSLVWCK